MRLVVGRTYITRNKEYSVYVKKIESYTAYTVYKHLKEGNSYDDVRIRTDGSFSSTEVNEALDVMCSHNNTDHYYLEE